MFDKSRKKIRLKLQNRYDTSGLSLVQKYYGEQMAYGHREILLDYIGLPKNLYFKAVIPHGRILPNAIVPLNPSFDANGDQIQQLLWRTDGEDEAKSKKINAISIGAPGIYALLNENMDLKDIDRNIVNFGESYLWSNSYFELKEILFGKKILYMPSHSWDGDVITQSKLSLDFLFQFGTSNVIVCLGYLDFIDPQTRLFYTSRGFQVECVGIRASKVFNSPAGGRVKFLYNLFRLFDKVDYVIADEFTTGLYYAAAYGLKIGLLPREFDKQLTFSSWTNTREYEVDMTRHRNYLPWLCGEAAKSSEIIEELRNGLGIYSIKSKEALSSLVPLIENSRE